MGIIFKKLWCDASSNKNHTNWYIAELLCCQKCEPVLQLYPDQSFQNRNTNHQFAFIKVFPDGRFCLPWQLGMSNKYVTLLAHWIGWTEHSPLLHYFLGQPSFPITLKSLLGWLHPPPNNISYGQPNGPLENYPFTNNIISLVDTPPTSSLFVNFGSLTHPLRHLFGCWQSQIRRCKSAFCLALSESIVSVVFLKNWQNKYQPTVLLYWLMAHACSLT